MRRPLVAIVAAALTATALSCALFYDLGTNGYSTSQEAGGSVGDCGADAACPTLALGCLGANNCDGGMVCCVSLTSLSSAQSTCSAGPCSPPMQAQLCQTSSECGDASCVAQTCTLGSTTVGIQACGAHLLLCTTP